TKEECAGYYARLTTLKSKYGRPFSVDSHRNMLAEAKSFLRWCVAREWLRVNPLENVQGVGKRNMGKPQLTADEASRWCQTALVRAMNSEEGALAALMALLMRLRASKITKRVVRDLDQGGRVLRITDAKTRKGNRTIVVPAVLRPLLAQRIEGRAPTA